jgi:hypothetical protein
VTARSTHESARGGCAALVGAALAVAGRVPDRVRATPAGLRGLRKRAGAAAVDRLRAALAPLCGAPDARSPLLDALEPLVASWRAAVRRPDVLPHHPMVLHRGGYPDGS